jgi:hypothetical protein
MNLGREKVDPSAIRSVGSETDNADGRLLFEVSRSLTKSNKRRCRKNALRISGEIVPPGSLKPNPNHPFAHLTDGKTRRDEFLDQLTEALAEAPKKEAQGFID